METPVFTGHRFSVAPMLDWTEWPYITGLQSFERTRGGLLVVIHRL